MENTIMVKGTVHSPESFFSKEGKEGTRFKLAVYAGKMDGGYAPSVWYTVKIMERLSLNDKQRDVVVDGYFGASKATDGSDRVFHTLWAKRVLVPNATPQQAPQSVQDAYGDLPF
jgi:hypothetical protein